MSSPADGLRALVADYAERGGEIEWHDEASAWIEDNAANVLALIDAAQDTVDNANLVCDEEILLDRALRALSEPRP